MALQKFKAPALPQPGREYDQQYLMQLIRVLGIYFNQLDSLTPNQAQSYTADNFYGGLFSGNGYGVLLPHIAASDSGNQYATATNTPTLVTWDTLDSGYEWTLNSPGSATADVAGVYTIRYSLQFINTANTAQNAWVWLRKNGTDVVGSTSRFSLAARKSAGDYTYNLGYSEASFTVDVGDEIELYWATDLAYSTSGPTDGIYIFANTAQTSPFARPSLPSAIGSIAFLSALPPA